MDYPLNPWIQCLVFGQSMDCPNSHFELNICIVLPFSTIAAIVTVGQSLQKVKGRARKICVCVISNGIISL